MARKKLSTKQIIFTAMIGSLLKQIEALCLGYEVTFGEVYRPEVTQRHYVNTGKSKTMSSKHRQRLAIDLNLFINGVYCTNSEKYRPLGVIWEGLGGRWGGRFGIHKSDYDTAVGWDAGHFEYKD